MNEPLTDSIHELAKRHRKIYRDGLDGSDPELRGVQDHIRALMQEYMPHDMVREIFDSECLGEGLDGMVIVMGSGFALTVPI